MDNAEVAGILEKIADLLDVVGENPFRTRAYRNAARVINGLPDSVAKIAVEQPEELPELPNIGKDLAAKIIEIATTGSHPLLRDLEAKVPEGLIAMMNIPGVGPKRAKLFWDELEITPVEAMERAARDGKLRELKGIGEKLEQKILDGCASIESRRGRMSLEEADRSVKPLIERLREVEGILAIDLAGSVRRRKETIGDIDVLVASNAPGPIAESVVAHADVASVLARGQTKCSVMLKSGIQVDVRIVEPDCWGAALQYFTGSKAHNIAIRHIALKKGLKLSEYGVFRGTERVAGKTEEDVYRALDLDWIPPELREDRGEIDMAREHRLPALVAMDDISGDGEVDASVLDACKARGYAWAGVRGGAPSIAGLVVYDTVVLEKRGRLLSSRAKAPEELDRIRYALDAARRDGCSKNDIVNTARSF